MLLIFNENEVTIDVDGHVIPKHINMSIIAMANFVIVLCGDMIYIGKNRETDECGYFPSQKLSEFIDIPIIVTGI